MIQEVNVHLVVRDAARAAAWYAQALGATEVGRIPVPGGKFMQIELRLGDATVMLADEFPEAGIVGPQTLGGSPAAFHLVTDDVAPLWNRAVAAGAKELQPLGERFWGERFGQLLDPFGYRWNLAQRVREVPRDEVARAAWEAFGGGAHGPGAGVR
jgi:PhnB protein